jgi:biopolymer transport protein ExbD
MSMNVGENKGGAIADINVTPMADIMIVLLIIFMVITPMISKGVDVKLPTASNTKERKEEQKTITVGLKKDGSLFLGSAPLASTQELVSQIRQRLEDLPEGQRMIFLKADSELEYGQVMKVMDLCREAGIEEVSFIAERRVQGSS